MIRDFIVRCAQALGCQFPDVRVWFSIADGRVRVAVSKAPDTAVVRFTGAGADEVEAIAAASTALDEASAATLAKEIAALEERKRKAHGDAVAAERQAALSRKEADAARERAFKAAKAFKEALDAEDDARALPRKAEA